MTLPLPAKNVYAIPQIAERSAIGESFKQIEQIKISNKTEGKPTISALLQPSN